MRRASGHGSGSEIGVSSKAYPQQGHQVVGVDLRLKLQNQNRPLLGNQGGDRLGRSDGEDDDDDDVDGGIRGGPTCNVHTNSNSSMMIRDIYDVAVNNTVVSDSTTGSLLRGLQPFDVSSPPPHPLFKSSGGMATATMGFPFTAAQWKELERQAMIYKYMVASLPVPPDLLYSTFPTSLSPQTAFGPASFLLGKYGSGLNLMRWSGNSKDAEPGRCRRTDGKKWRCSRDVAPNQKYCERHMHRGRPRSRKPVEPLLLPHHLRASLSDVPTSNNGGKVQNNPPKKTRLDGSSPQPVGSSLPSIPVPKASSFGHSMVSGANPFEDSRSLAWTEEQHWQQLMQTNLHPSALQHHFEGVPLNLNSTSHADFSNKSEMGLLERPLIDAWAMGVKDNAGNTNSSLCSNGTHGNAVHEDMCQIHMGLGVIDSWVTSPTSPGGPLAEALRPGASRSASDAGEGDFVTPPATAVSSPSGVLQKTFTSFSDSSGSNSPIHHHSRANSDMPFQWLN